MDPNRIEGEARRLGGRIEESYGRLADDPEARIGGLGQQTAGAAQQIYGQAMDSLNDLADRASSLVEDVYGQARESAERTSRIINTQIETNPVAATLVAGLVGLLLGIATNVSRRRAS